MLTEEGLNGYGETHWKLTVPDEHCAPGLEVGIVATSNGLKIGGQLIEWNTLAVAKQKALGNL